MGRSSLIPLGAAALVVAVFAASSCSNDTTNVVIVQPDGGTVCDFASRGCPAGQACAAGAKGSIQWNIVPAHLTGEAR